MKTILRLSSFFLSGLLALPLMAQVTTIPGSAPDCNTVDVSKYSRQYEVKYDASSPYDKVSPVERDALRLVVQEATLKFHGPKAAFDAFLPAAGQPVSQIVWYVITDNFFGGYKDIALEIIFPMNNQTNRGVVSFRQNTFAAPTDMEIICFSTY